MWCWCTGDTVLGGFPRRGPVDMWGHNESIIFCKVITVTPSCGTYHATAASVATA